MVGKGTEAGKGALTLPSVRPGVGLPPTSSSSVPPRVCHHRHRPSLRLSLRTPTIRPCHLSFAHAPLFRGPRRPWHGGRRNDLLLLRCYCSPRKFDGEFGVRWSVQR